MGSRAAKKVRHGLLIHATNILERIAWLEITLASRQISSSAQLGPASRLHVPSPGAIGFHDSLRLKDMHANCALLQPDAESSICDDATCTRYFGYFTRRHHCRRCGNVFCDAHSAYVIPLDQHADYHPNGFRARSCDHCFKDYQRWRISQSSLSNSESSDGVLDTPTTPTVKCAGKAKGSMGGVFGPKNPGISESLGASVPRDWNWSTF